MSDIFLSYASENRDRIMPLVRALEATGWSVFWDRAIPTGKTWLQVIGKEIRDARSILVVWSEQSIDSAWVHEEADEGKRRGILFPIQMDNVLPPFGFGTIQAADLSSWDGLATSPAFRRLVGDLSRVLGNPPADVVRQEAEEEERRRRQEEAKREADEEAQRKEESLKQEQERLRKQREADYLRVAERRREQQAEQHRREEQARLEAEERAKLAALSSSNAPDQSQDPPTAQPIGVIRPAEKDRDAARGQQDTKRRESARGSKKNGAQGKTPAGEAGRAEAEQRIAEAKPAEDASRDEDERGLTFQVATSMDAVKPALVVAGLMVLVALLLKSPWSNTPAEMNQTNWPSNTGAKPDTNPAPASPPSEAAIAKVKELEGKLQAFESEKAVAEAKAGESQPTGKERHRPPVVGSFTVPSFRRAWLVEGGTSSIVVDGKGTVHVGTMFPGTIRLFDIDGRPLQTIVPEVDGGIGFLYALAIDSSENTLVGWKKAHEEIELMLVLNRDGTIVGKWGGPSGGANGHFSYVAGVAVDPDGAVYVADYWNHRIQVFDSRGRFLRSWEAGWRDFTGPMGLTITSSGEVFVADSGKHRIEVFSTSGTLLRKWGTKGRADGQFAEPYDVAVDADGIVYVADCSNNRIQAFDTEGNFVGKWGSLGTGSGQFHCPNSLATSGSGTVYVGERFGNRIQVFGR